ncbi:MAG: FAD-linked oxidase C-terminal domain-containing protein, partial [Gemmatimonadaceae bacterium]
EQRRQDELRAQQLKADEEHGIGRIKKAFLPVQYDADVLRALRAVKSWVDPEWRLNPGILLDPAP